jgi:putative PIN family toxin of toxin-antitoxin system
LDANVLISAAAFGGIPGEILRRFFAGNFLHVTAPNIMEEVRRNLTFKLKMSEFLVDVFLREVIENSSYLNPAGNLKTISHLADSKVLEAAIMGKCDVLVTGDKKHLLPLNTFQGVIIESPSRFLKRLDSLK